MPLKKTMPIITRKRTIRGALRDILIAPLVLVLAMTYANRWWLTLCALLAISLTWLNGVPLANLVPSRESLAIGLGTLAFIAFAAIPLAIRDYFANGGMETVWVRSEETTAAARSLAQSLLARDYSSYYKHFAPGLQARLPYDTFADNIAALTQATGPLIAIEDARELEFAAPQRFESAQPPSFDAIVQVTIAHPLGRKSMLTLHLMSIVQAQVVDFKHEPCET
jgi:hypothetical protein